MSNHRSDIERLLIKAAKPGTSWSIDAWPIGSTSPQRWTVSADWLRDGEPTIERITIQGVYSKERGYEELLAAVCMRLRVRT